ncbi:MAG: FtsX-like permease family protein [Lachnospiraceae bacterium]|nr:FtsX-like permease family protein [Lachnospiraceae bacterium]
MKKLRSSIAYRNLCRRTGRSIALIILAAFLSFAIFAGTVAQHSLKSGLDSLQNRLGADIMVVPKQAAAHSDLENIVLQGNTGYFYMDEDAYEKIAQTEGIGQISAQFFLASASSGCCSIPVQLIGFEPETDFTITPWIRKSYDSTLNDMEVVVGNDLNAFVGDTLTFYNQDVHVAAKLDKTGTSLDTAVYMNHNTLKTLLQASLDLGMNYFSDIDPDRVVSCVLINVADGYSIEEVLNDINIHVRKVKAVQTRNMISGISGSLSGISNIITGLAVAIWVLALVILVIAFTMSANERKKEFAILRVSGASRKRLSRIVMQEAAMICFAGSVIGVVIGCLVMIPFGNFIETQLGMPYLTPDVPWIVVVAVISLVVSAVAGSLTSIVASRKISRMDTGLILREN